MAISEQQARTILRALDVFREDIEADPDYAPDERAEWLGNVEAARVPILAEHPNRNANTAMRLRAEGIDPDSMTAKEVAERAENFVPETADEHYKRMLREGVDKQSARERAFGAILAREMKGDEPDA